MRPEDHLMIGLPLRAFQLKGKRLATLEKGGKGGDAPDAPDYINLANAQAAAQKKLAEYTTDVNRVNQVTPTGSLTYSKNSATTFDQAGFDRATADYKTALSAWKAASKAGGVVLPNNTGWNLPSSVATSRGSVGPMPTAPTRSQFTKTGNPSWTATQTLSPDQQAILDKQEALSQALLTAGEGAVPHLTRYLSEPIDGGMKAQDAIMSRLEPYFNRRLEGMESRLTNQGITRGSEAWNRGMDELGRTQNDAYIQAGLHGINTDMSLQSHLANLLSAVRTGNQVTQPNFAPVPQQSMSQAPDMLGAANATYGANVQKYNADQASSGSFLNGLMGLGSAFLTSGASLPFMGASTVTGGTSIPINFGMLG
jgi:hypothetical protein